MLYDAHHCGKSLVQIIAPKVEYISARCTHRRKTLLVHYNIPNKKLYRILAMKIRQNVDKFFDAGERVTV